MRRPAVRPPPKLTGSFRPREAPSVSQEGLKRRIDELERDLRAKTASTDEGLKAEIERLKETNFDLEASLQTVEAEKQFAIQQGIAAAKTELQFKENELKTELAARNVQQQQHRLTKKAATTTTTSSSSRSSRDRFNEILFEDPADVVPALALALGDAALNVDRRGAVEKLAAASKFRVAEALVPEVPEIDREFASRVAQAALSRQKYRKDLGYFVVALHRSAGLDAKTTRLALDSLSSLENDDDDVLAEFAADACTRDAGVFDDVVWPAVAKATHKAATRPRSSSKVRGDKQCTVLRAAVDLASAIAVDDPERARRLLAAKEELLPDILNFANDSFEAYLKQRRRRRRRQGPRDDLDHHRRGQSLTSSSFTFDDDDNDAASAAAADHGGVDALLDDARAVIHLLGHVAFFADAGKFEEDIYRCGNDLAAHELRALCHRAKYALEEGESSTALDRDADQLLLLFAPPPLGEEEDRGGPPVTK